MTFIAPSIQYSCYHALLRFERQSQVQSLTRGCAECERVVCVEWLVFRRYLIGMHREAIVRMAARPLVHWVAFRTGTTMVRSVAGLESVRSQ